MKLSVLKNKIQTEHTRNKYVQNYRYELDMMFLLYEKWDILDRQEGRRVI